jgi:hypothetical protein
MSDVSWSEAVRWTHPRHPQAPPPGPGFEGRLEEREIWTDRSGVMHRLDEMSDDYLWAVLGYLRWYAPEIRSLVPDDERLDALPIANWLEMQPVWGAIACELVRRALIDRPSDALAALVASGPVPWEVTGGK